MASLSSDLILRMICRRRERGEGLAQGTKREENEGLTSSNFSAVAVMAEGGDLAEKRPKLFGLYPPLVPPLLAGGRAREGGAGEFFCSLAGASLEGAGD